VNGEWGIDRYDVVFVLALLMALGGIGVMLYDIYEHSECISNTVTVLKWAKEQGKELTCSASCDFAVNEYIQTHGLSWEEFPTCCWFLDNYFATGKQKLGAVMFFIGSMMFGYRFRKKE